MCINIDFLLHAPPMRDVFSSGKRSISRSLFSKLADIPCFLSCNLSRHLSLADEVALRQAFQHVNKALEADGGASINICCAGCYCQLLNTAHVPECVKIVRGRYAASQDLEIRSCMPTGNDWSRDEFVKWVDTRFVLMQGGHPARACRRVHPNQRGTFYGYGTVDVRLHIPVECQCCFTNLGQLLIDDGTRTLCNYRWASAIQFRQFKVIYVDHRGVECGPDGRELASHRSEEFRWENKGGKFVPKKCFGS